MTSSQTKCCTFLTALCMISGFGQMGRAADLYVAPDGRDTWSGQRAAVNADGTDGPLATVAAAQRLLRRMREAQPAHDGPWVVALRGGTYELTEPLTFTPEDSGSEASPVI